MTPMHASATEKTLHWTVAISVLVLIATGAVMYVPWLSQVVGQRFWVRTSHLAAATLLVAAVLTISAFRWREVRLMERELSFWDQLDWNWFRRPWDVFLSEYAQPRAIPRRFNAGQKLLASLVGISLAILLISGVPMYWWWWLGREVVQRARDLHVVASFALTALIAGHVYLAAFGPSGLIKGRSEQREAVAASGSTGTGTVGNAALLNDGGSGQR